MATGITITLTHTGLSQSSIMLDDLKASYDGSSAGRREGYYVPVGGTLELSFGGLVPISFEIGDIFRFIQLGHLTAVFNYGVLPQQGSEGLVLMFTSATTGVGTDKTFVKAAAGAMTLQLPPVAEQIGLVVLIDAFGDAATNNVTVLPAAGETIDGAVSSALSEDWGKLEFWAKLGGWFTPAAVSGPPAGPAGGSLSGTYPNPSVAGIRTTFGPTDLPIGSITATQVLQRVGATVAGIDIGTGIGTLCAGDDSRLSDARTPTAHVHSGADITSGTVAYAYLPVGTGASTVAAGDDSRLSDPRAPTGAAGGDLGGFYPSPQVAALTEAGSSQQLTLGAVPDGSALVRVGTGLVGWYFDAPSQGLGGGNTEGTATTVARADHDHTIRETGGPADLTVGAIPAGAIVQRTGAALVGGLAASDVFLKDGSIAATADFDLGGNNLTSIGNVDGRDVSTDGSNLDAFRTKPMLTDVQSATRANPGATTVNVSADAEFGPFSATPGVIGDGSVTGIPVLLETVGGTGSHEFNTTTGRVSVNSAESSYRVFISDTSGAEILDGADPVWAVITATARTIAGTYTLRFFSGAWGSGAESTYSMAQQHLLVYPEGDEFSGLPYAGLRSTNVNISGAAGGLAPNSVTSTEALTAAPGVGVGAGNTEGVAASLARSDHNHTLRETGGPTDLTLGSIAANSVVQRVGGSLVGITIGVGAGTLAAGDDARFTDARTPTAHDLTGALHNNTTLANLNAKITDATLIDTGDARLSDARTPTAHVHAGADITSGTVAYTRLPVGVIASTVAAGDDARFTNARTPTGAAGGQLGSTYPNPDVRGLRETSGPTLLTLGAVADGHHFKRSGGAIVGEDPGVALSGVKLFNSGVVTSYSTIAAALLAAVSGNTVQVGPGTYAESVTVPDGVVLHGSLEDSAIITGAGAGGYGLRWGWAVICTASSSRPPTMRTRLFWSTRPPGPTRS